MSWRDRRVLAGLALVALILIAGAAWIGYWHRFAWTDDARVEADIVVVASRIGGRITGLSVREMDRVQAGQTLAEIDRRDPAALQAREASNAEAYIRLQEAERELQAVEIHLRNARADLERGQGLAREGSIAQSQLEDLEARVKDLETQREKALLIVRLRRDILAATEAEPSLFPVTAPVTGMIAQKLANDGEVVRAGQILLKIADLSRVWITANVEETDVGRIRPGQSAEVKVDAFPGQRWTGRVEEIGAATLSTFSVLPPQNVSGTFIKVTQRIPVRIVLPENVGRLRPGMSAVVKIRVVP